MRRHIVFVFIFIFWGLAVCTVLSEKIEEQMTAEVFVQRAEDYSLPLDALFWDEEGQHLYKVVNGEGWEAGKRVNEVNRGNFWLNEDRIGVNDSHADYIRYASKEISPWELVEMMPLYEGGPEDYLVIEADDARIVSVEEGLKPFMQEAIKVELGLPEESTVYNLNDVKSFFGNFPILGGIVALLLASIILWTYSWRCSRELRKNRVLLGANVLVSVGMFWGFQKLVQKLEFPSSLLPQKNILRFGYYKNQFIEIFEALKEGSQSFAEEIIGIFTSNCIICGVFVLFVLVISLIFIKAESKIFSSKRYLIFKMISQINEQ